MGLSSLSDLVARLEHAKSVLDKSRTALRADRIAVDDRFTSEQWAEKCGWLKGACDTAALDLGAVSARLDSILKRLEGIDNFDLFEAADHLGFEVTITLGTLEEHTNGSS